ncbi:MAG: dihydroxy-acid dehydratase [Bryobacter sp.]|nr:dihydroxy-acid dehydratase [Bryobacter sp.]
MATKLRSEGWFDKREYYSFARKSTWRAQGWTAETTEGRPVIGICNTASDLNPCNAHFRELAEDVKRGVWAAGGVAAEFPVISLGEMFLKPTAMLYRNLMSMDVEEMIRANPLDAVVLLGACDKTVPALLMGAASADVPAILVPGGPMLRGTWQGKTLGSGTDGRKLFDLYREGTLDEGDMEDLACGLARSAGHCMVMGTASSMALVAEALGMTLPGAAAWPAVDGRRAALAEASGRRAVEMALAGGPRPSEVMTREAIENAIAVLMAAGGSTNAVVHLLAIAGRLGVPLKLDDFAAISARTPLLADVKPHGEYLMEDFAYAGGGPALMKMLGDCLHLGTRTVKGETLGEALERFVPWEQKVIRELAPEGGIRVLRGNLAPEGALIKVSAASPELLEHRGRAVVFESKEEMTEKVNDESFAVEPGDVLVLRNAGPLGGPGMPEWGHIPMPKSLLRRGVKDMVRISDARMSGTSFGTVVLHISPEARAGGALGALETGDEIVLEAGAGRLSVGLDEATIAQRLAVKAGQAQRPPRGYAQLYWDQVEQAHLGCDFRFLKKQP